MLTPQIPGWAPPEPLREDKLDRRTFLVLEVPDEAQGGPPQTPHDTQRHPLGDGPSSVSKPRLTHADHRGQGTRGLEELGQLADDLSLSPSTYEQTLAPTVNVKPLLPYKVNRPSAHTCHILVCIITAG